MKKLINKIYLGFLHIHILYHANQSPIYGVWMIDELRDHGYQIGPSHIYPLLKSFVEEGLLEIEEMIIDGHQRKYYHITSDGRGVLFDLIEKVKELSDELFESNKSGGSSHE